MIKNTEARKDAESAAKIILNHGFELPRLRVVDMGKSQAGATYTAPLAEGLGNGVINFNKKRERDYRKYKEKKMALRSGAQDNTFLHELGHYVDYMLEPKAYRGLEHQHKMTESERSIAGTELSRYAMENRAEFEAELISAIMRGKTFSKNLLSLSRLNSPENHGEFASKLLDLGSGQNLCLPDEDLREKFKDMMTVMFQKSGATFDINILANKDVQSFIEHHAELMDRTLTQLPLSDAMRRRLSRSNFIFSGMKTFHELNEAFPSLVDENGNRKSFERFLNDVRSIDSTYNEHYLRAEYNFVNASAEMAARWESFAEDGDRYNLQYRTAGDDKVRPGHAALNGVTLPMSDSFWEEFYPPNGWNCRCTVVQVRKSKYPATPHDEAMRLGDEALQRDTKGIFRFNPGLEQKSVPDYNPYTIRRCRDCDIAKGKLKLARSFVPDNEVCAACKYIRSCLEFRRDPVFVDFRKSIVEDATKLKARHTNLATGNIYQTKKSFKRGIAHAMNIEEAEMFSKINGHISDLVYVRESPLGEVKDMTTPKAIANIQKKRERGVTGYNVYELQLDGDTWIVKTEVYKGHTEAIYHIKKKE